MPPAERAPLGATLALTIAAVVALFGLAAALGHAVVDPTVLPPPFSEQNQDVESLLFVLTFAILLPAALFVVPRVTDRIAAAAGPAALDALAASLTIALIGLLILVKVSEHLPWGDGLGVLAAAVGLWCLLAAPALAAAARGRLTVPAPLAERSGALWLGAVGLLVVLVLCFVEIRSIDVLPLIVGLALVVAAIAWLTPRIPRLGGRWGAVVDGTAVVLLLLAVPNVVIFTFGTPAREIDDTILQFHQNFFLGPANQVLGGGAMLVDTLSQYGVGSIYFLAGAFQFLPISNGTLGLVEGLLSAATFIAAYAVLRVAGVSRPLAWGTLAVAVVALVYGLVYPLGGLLQHGAIRFGLPVVVIAAAVFATRWPRRAPVARALGLIAVGVSSIWALEAFAYTLLTLAGILAFQAWMRPPAERLRWLLRRVSEVVAACVAVHLLLATITLAATGEWPDWGMYLDTLRAFLVGGVGELTYDFTRWSTALPVGVLYVASAAAIVLLIRSNRSMAEERRIELVALSGSTAWGTALFSYFVNRSADHILPYICLPAVMVTAIWLALVLRGDPPVSAVVRRAASAAAGGLAVLLVAVAWSGAGTRFEQSALAHVVPGGDSLGTALDVLEDPPELAKGADAAEELLVEEMPGEDESIVLTSADLGVEVLVATDRINRIPLADPWEESLVPEQHLPALEEAVSQIHAGDLVLLDRPSARLFDAYVREPARDPLAEPFSQSTIVPSGVAVLQEWVLKELGDRFELEPVAQGEDGVFVAELVAR